MIGKRDPVVLVVLAPAGRAAAITSTPSADRSAGMPSAAVLGPRSIAIRHLQDDGLRLKPGTADVSSMGLNGARRCSPILTSSQSSANALGPSADRGVGRPARKIEQPDYSVISSWEKCITIVTAIVSYYW